MPSSTTIAESIHSTWAARGRVPSVKDILDVMEQSHEAGHRAGAVDLANQLRDVLKRNYAEDRRHVLYSDAIDMLIAVVNNEVVNLAGEVMVTGL